MRCHPGFMALQISSAQMRLEQSMGNNLGVRYHFLDRMPIRWVGVNRWAMATSVGRQSSYAESEYGTKPGSCTAPRAIQESPSWAVPVRAPQDSGGCADGPRRFDCPGAPRWSAESPVAGGVGVNGPVYVDPAVEVSFGFDLGLRRY